MLLLSPVETVLMILGSKPVVRERSMMTNQKLSPAVTVAMIQVHNRVVEVRYMTGLCGENAKESVLIKKSRSVVKGTP